MPKKATIAHLKWNLFPKCTKWWTLVLTLTSKVFVGITFLLYVEVERYFLVEWPF